MRIPEQGWSKQQVIATLEQFRAGDMPWRDGRTWAYVYDPGRRGRGGHQARLHDVPHARTRSTRPCSRARCAGERAGRDGGGASARRRRRSSATSPAAAPRASSCGQDRARPRPRAAAADPRARDGAADDRARGVPQGRALPGREGRAGARRSEDFQGRRREAMRAAITPNTILLVGSAVSYAHGVVDPIASSAQLALEKTCCSTSTAAWAASCCRTSGASARRCRDFEFDVPGVTSISMDFHKYAFAAKGASVILLPRARSCDATRSTRARTGRATRSSTRRCRAPSRRGPLAAAWAALHFIGDDGLPRDRAPGARRDAAHRRRRRRDARTCACSGDPT